MVSGCGAAGGSRGAFPTSRKRREKWGTRIFGSGVSSEVPEDARKVCFARGCCPVALARVQRCGLSKSAGVSERALLCEGDRTKDWDGESGQGKYPRCQFVFSERCGAGCGRDDLAGTTLAS